MSFTLCPDDGPPRLIRLTNELKYPVLSVLDKETNVLQVNRELFDTLSKSEQDQLFKTTIKVTKVPPGLREPWLMAAE